jgi:tetratricopeptide (TPR) repeat protein
MMAGAHASLGDFPAAARVSQQMGSEAALQRVGELATEAGDLDAAQEAYTAAWRLNPKGKCTSTLASFLWGHRKDPAAAEAVVRSSIERYPRAPHRHSWLLLLARTLDAQERWTEAIDVYRQALAEKPNDAVAWYRAAWTYHRSGQAEAAVTAIERAIALDPAAVRHHARAGRIYEATGQIDKALVAYRQALVLQPENSTALKGVERLAGGP